MTEVSLAGRASSSTGPRSLELLTRKVEGGGTGGSGMVGMVEKQ